MVAAANSDPRGWDMKIFIRIYVLIAAAIVFCSSSVSAASKPVLNDWFALGSGCRARSDLVGNVDMQRVAAARGKSQIYSAKFVLKNFVLEGGEFPTSIRQYGRECAIRLNINPPQGKKIVAIRAKTSVDINKNTGSSLDLLSELKLGPESLARFEEKFQSTESISIPGRSIQLSSGRGSKMELPQLGCGEPKIIGFDYSWIASKESDIKGRLKVELSRDKSLLLEAELENCVP